MDQLDVTSDELKCRCNIFELNGMMIFWAGWSRDPRAIWSDSSSFLFLGDPKLLLQALWHLGRQWTRQTQLHLHCIVDEPLEGGKCTNHNDPWAKSTPESFESKILHSRAEGGTLHFVHVGHQGVCRVRDNGTEDASNISSSKCDHQLLRLAALVSWLGHHIGVNRLNSSLEASKLHHGVGNLTTPEGHEGLVEPLRPSARYRVGAAPLSVVGKVPSFEVCILTLTASIGLRAMSAKNSAEADAAK